MRPRHSYHLLTPIILLTGYGGRELERSFKILEVGMKFSQALKNLST